MTDILNKKMDLNRFQEIVDVYGADSLVWPDEFKEEAMRFSASSQEAALIVKQAQELQSLLQEVAVVEPSNALQRAVAQIPIRHARRFSWTELLPFGSIWKVTTAAVLVGALGLFLGIASLQTPDSNATLNSWDEYESLAFATEFDQEIEP